MTSATHAGTTPAARQTPMAHAFALLLEEREVLLEHAQPDGTVIRESARLTGGAQPDTLLHVTPEARRQRWSELPHGTALVLIVPVMHRRWRFLTTVVREPGGGDDTVLAWPSGIEQVIGRVAARATLAIAVDVRALGQSPGTPARRVSTYTLDVSTSGVQLVLPALWPRGTRLELTLRFARARRTVPALVMWTSAADEPRDPLHRTGLAFEKPTPLFTHELRELLGSAAPKTANGRTSAGTRAA